MDIEQIIKQCNLGKDSRVKFKNDDKTYYVKNISPDRIHIFVTIDNTVIYRKKISNLIKCDSISIMESGKEIIKQLLREWSAKPVRIEFSNYRDAQIMLGTKSSVNLNNTGTVKLHRGRNDKELCVRLYNTDVVCFNEIGNLTIRNGGYETPMTSRVINNFLPEGTYVFQKKHNWYITGKNGTFPFYGGIQVTSSGDILYEEK